MAVPASARRPLNDSRKPSILNFSARSLPDCGPTGGGQCVCLIPGNAAAVHAAGKWALSGRERASGGASVR